MKNGSIVVVFFFLILLIIIAGVMMLSPSFSKGDAVINVLSNSTLYDGDFFSISLTDIDGNPLAGQTVNITIIDANGGLNHQQVTTDEMGNGILQLNGLTAGVYTVNITYGGNDNYSANYTTCSLEMKEKEIVQQSSSSDSGDYVYSPQYGTYIKQYTDSNGVQHVAGSNGMHESYNPNTGRLVFDDGHGHVDSDYRG